MPRPGFEPESSPRKGDMIGRTTPPRRPTFAKKTCFLNLAVKLKIYNNLKMTYFHA